MSAPVAIRSCQSTCHMPRYRLLIEYDGTPFIGLADPRRRSVGAGRHCRGAGEADGALQRMCAARRTDSGVHAMGQVAHVDLPRPYPAYVVREAINCRVRPMPVSVLEVRAGAGHIRRAVQRGRGTISIG